MRRAFLALVSSGALFGLAFLATAYGVRTAFAVAVVVGLPFLWFNEHRSDRK